MVRQAAAIALGSVLVGVAVPARAEDIPAVNFTSSGPDRDLPVGKAFYVAGIAREAARSVQAFVVRKGSPAIWGGDGPACSALRTQLGAFRDPSEPGAGAKADAAKADAAKAGAAMSADPAVLDKGYTVREPGLFDASEIWQRGTGRALVTAAWQRGDLTGSQTYKLLVSGDREFFRAGYAYCLFVLTRDDVKTSVEAQVRVALEQHVAAMRACVVPPTPCDPACVAQRRKCEDDASAKDDPACVAERERRKCEDGAITKIVAATKQLGVPAADQLLDAAIRLRGHPWQLMHMLEWWRRASDPTADGRSFLKQVDLEPFLHLADPLATAIAQMMVFRGGLFPPAGSGRPYHALGGAKITQLGLRADGQVLGSRYGTAASSSPLTVTLDQLTLPGSALSVRDLVELTQGQIKLAGPSYQSIAAILLELRDDFAAPYGADDSKLTTLITLQKQVAGLADATRRAFAASAGFDCKSRYTGHPEPPAGPERALGEWLRCRVVERSKKPDDPGEACAMLRSDWTNNGVKMPPECVQKQTPNPKAWPGYRDRGMSPLDAIDVSAKDLIDAHATWRAARTSLVKPGVEITAVRSAGKIGFTQETWLGSYLTPVLGYSHVPYADSTLFYAGVQLHAYPNPVDEPQWSLGGRADVMRAFALELGFAPGAGAFGPDGRYDGPWSLPPLMFGVALHPVPYASISAGWLLGDARTTTLDFEKRRVEKFGYIAVSLQGNLPDLLYKQLGHGLKTSAEK